MENTINSSQVADQQRAPVPSMGYITKEAAREFLTRADDTPSIYLPMRGLPACSSNATVTEDTECPDCEAEQYEKHSPYCSIAHCHLCGRRLTNCLCKVGPIPSYWDKRDVVEEACDAFGFYCASRPGGFAVSTPDDEDAEIDFCRLYCSGEAEWNVNDQQWLLVNKKDLPVGHDTYGCIAARSDVNKLPTLLSPGKYWIGDPCYGSGDQHGYYCWDTGSDGGASVRRKRKIVGSVGIDTARVAVFDFEADIRRPDLGVGIILESPEVIVPHVLRFSSGANMQVGFEFGPFLVGSRR